MSNANRINYADNYEDKLNIWRDLGLNQRTHYWVGDFSLIRNRYDINTYPKPKLYLSIHPNTIEQVVKFNMLNIENAINEIGSFESYKFDYTSTLDGQLEKGAFQKC